jgi:uncharacterized membrane protein
MTDADMPPGWSHNSSTWPRRLPVLVLALAGCAVAVYLTLYQVDVLTSVWEPFFGNGSRQILKESALARRLPIPDAALGAAAYLAEAVLEMVGGRDRWQRRPGLVAALGIVAAGLVLAAVVLVGLQAFVFRAFCTLCLVSAACSLLAGAAVVPEVWAAWQQLRRARARGRSWWQALSGRAA